jgi:hypothetical protein
MVLDMKDEFSIARKVASSAGCVFLQIDNHDLGFLTIRLLPKLTLDESVQSVGAYFSITGNTACVVNAGSRPRGLNSSEVFALFEGFNNKGSLSCLYFYDTPIFRSI